MHFFGYILCKIIITEIKANQSLINESCYSGECELV